MALFWCILNYFCFGIVKVSTACLACPDGVPLTGDVNKNHIAIQSSNGKPSDLQFPTLMHITYLYVVVEQSHPSLWQ